MDVLQYFCHPLETLALLKLRWWGCEAVHAKCDMKKMEEDRQLCYSMLKQTSRSFSAVIMALESDLGYAVCIFYLVLRALDTIEDDMSIPLDVKLPLLRSFHKNLHIPGWNYLDSREKDAVVLNNFHVISAQFRRLAKGYQDVISDTCHRMAEGMVVFLEKNSVVDTYQEWDQYCHYVAGLVGIGLSRLFSASQLEHPAVAEREHLSNSMGLFLQKTNIIRDFHEDIRDQRRLWPAEVLRHTGNPHLTLDDLLLQDNRPAALSCLDELVGNGLTHVPDVMEYLHAIRTPSVFAFCAIPQVMAMATLERCFNNPTIFTGKVKIRRGESAFIINNCTDMAAVHELFRFYTNKP
ncbi:squalene synthase-like isoform X2 [Paramacrobiotus metropolitanus]|uniref:squalene synthase-like isoform X2 n=1 Tax=Paramacrobiotus metropolitanus TaxID=2943436 RepID=UPI002445608A|nr:squalene synthase-like isoform X2 [Paramacrobiotus metropolitanus]